jgi:hypothetical protein
MMAGLTDHQFDTDLYRMVHKYTDLYLLTSHGQWQKQKDLLAILPTRS